MKLRMLKPEEVEICAKLTFMTKSSLNDCYSAIEEQSWVMKALSKHARARGLLLTEDVKILIHAICDGVIGHVVSYLEIIDTWAKNNNHNQIDLDTLFARVSPDGVPDFKAAA